MEQDILCNDPKDELNPDYGWNDSLPETRLSFQARSGEYYSRHFLTRGRTYDLTWTTRTAAVAEALRQWEHRFRGSFFTLGDLERGRYFSGMFAGPLTFTPAQFNRWNIKGQFTELPGLPMHEYPSDWETYGSLFEETDDFGQQLPKLAGAWNLVNDAHAHGKKAYESSTATDLAEWLYFGYGFRLWISRGPDMGKIDLSVISSYLGVTQERVLGPIDLYAAGPTAASPLGTTLNLPLGAHRVKLVVRADHNGASSGYRVQADAIEVMS